MKKVWVLSLAVLLLILTFAVYGGGKVDINNASVKELMSLPGIGAVTAERIVEHEQPSPFLPY